MNMTSPYLNATNENIQHANTQKHCQYPQTTLPMKQSDSHFKSGGWSHSIADDIRRAARKRGSTEDNIESMIAVDHGANDGSPAKRRRGLADRTATAKLNVPQYNAYWEGSARWSVVSTRVALVFSKEFIWMTILNLSLSMEGSVTQK